MAAAGTFGFLRMTLAGLGAVAEARELLDLESAEPGHAVVVELAYELAELEPVPMLEPMPALELEPAPVLEPAPGLVPGPMLEPEPVPILEPKPRPMLVGSEPEPELHC